MLKFSDENIKEYQDLISSGKPLVLLASAEWCNPCKAMKPMFGKVSEQMKDQLSFGTLDTDYGQDIASSLRISAIPTIVFIKNSIVKNTLVGIHSEKEVTKLIKELLSDE
jgi:thioredoxin 1